MNNPKDIQTSIPLLSELIEDYKIGKFDTLSDDTYLFFYPTVQHKEAGEKYAWLMPIQQLKSYSQFKDDLEEKKDKLFSLLIK